MTLLSESNYTIPVIKTLKCAGDIAVAKAEDIKAAAMVPGSTNQNTLQNWLDFLSGGVYRGRWERGVVYKKGDVVTISGEDNFFKALVDTPNQTSGPGIILLHWLPLNNWRGIFSDLKSYHQGSFVEYSGHVYLSVYNINYGSGITPDNHAGWVQVSDSESLYKGNWTSTRSYYTGDLVNSGGGLYICRNDNVQSNSGPATQPDDWAPMTDWRGDWDTEVYYPAGTTVKHNGQVWFATGNSSPSSSAPNGTHSKWIRISPQFRGNWAATNTYYRAEMVWHNNHMWICRNNNVLSSTGPNGDNTNWDPLPVFRGDYSSSSYYEKGDIVLSLDQIWLTVGSITSNQRPGSHANWIRISDRYRGTWALNVAYRAGDISLHSNEYYIARANGTPTSNSSAPSSNTAGWRRISFTGTDISITQNDGYADIESSTGANASIYDVDSSVSGLMSPGHYSKLDALPTRSQYDDDLDGKADTDLQNIDSDLTSSEKGAVRNRIGAGTGDPFHLHNHVNRYVSTGISGSDRIVFSDESAAGDPNTYTTFDNFKSALNIPTAFDLHDDVVTSSTITNEDRLVFSDESVSGDPNRYTTFANLKIALNLPDPSLKANVNLQNISSSLSNSQKGTVRSRIGAGTPFDLHDHVSTSATISGTDRLLFSDEGTSGDPNRYTTFSDFKTALDIPGSIVPFHIHNHVDSSSTIANSDRLVFSDESETNDPNRYTTFANFRAALNIPTAFDIREDVTTSATISDSDRIIFSDEDVSGDPNRYTTFANFKSALNIPTEFDLHNDVSTSATITDSDRILFSDEGTTGAPNRFTTIANFKTALQIPAEFIINDDVTTSATIADSDRIVFSDRSVSGNPNRYTTFANLKSALSIPDISGKADTDLQNIDTDLTNTEKSNIRTRIGAGTSSFDGNYNNLSNRPSIPGIFDLHDDVSTSATITDSDRILFSDEDTSGDPNRYTTFANFKSALNIPAAATGFDIHDDVTTSSTISDSDRLVFSDESESGDPNRYTTFANLRSALNIPAAATAFDLHDDVTNSATISSSDRILFSDEGETGDPNRYTTFANFKTALSIPDVSGKADTNLQNISSSLSNTQKSTVRTRIGAGDGDYNNLDNKPTIPTAFDLHDDVTTSATIANSDRILFSDESETGDPNRYTTFANFKSVLNIPTAFDIHNDVTTSATIVDSDRIIFSDEGTDGDPNRYTTFANFKSALSIPGQFDLHDDVSTSSTISGSDRILFSDEDVSGDPNRYTTFSNFKSALNIPTAFDLHDDVSTSATITDNDRILFSDEDTSDDPHRYTTFANFKAALSIPDVSGKANTDLQNIDTDLTNTEKATVRSRIGAGDGNYNNLSNKPSIPTAFDIHDDVTTAATIADDDKVIFSDQSETGDPNRYTTFSNFRTALNIPSATPAFDLHDHVDTSSTIANDDRLVFSDESETGDPNRYITFSDFKDELDIPTTLPWTSITSTPPHLGAPVRLGAQWITALPTQSSAYVISYTFDTDTDATYIIIPESGVVEINAFCPDWIGGTVRVPAAVLRASREADSTAHIHQVGRHHNNAAYGITFCCNAQHQLMMWSNTRTASSNYYIDVLHYNNGYWSEVPDHTMPNNWPNLRAS